MKILFYFRVAILSLEFVVFLLCIMIITTFSERVNHFLPNLDVSNDFLKYFMLVPIALLVWSAKQYHELLIGEGKNTKILVNWPDYWKLKATFHVGFVYSFIFCLLSAIALLPVSKTLQSTSLIVFTCACLGSFVVASSIFFARVSISDLFNLD